jgi:hypothetical protein
MLDFSRQVRGTSSLIVIVPAFLHIPSLTSSFGKAGMIFCLPLA